MESFRVQSCTSNSTPRPVSFRDMSTLVQMVLRYHRLYLTGVNNKSKHGIVILRNAGTSRLRPLKKRRLMSGSQIPLPMPYKTGHNLLRAGCSALRAGKHGDPLSIEIGRVHLADLSQAGKGFILQPSHILGGSLENTRFIANHQIGSRCLPFVRQIQIGRRREKSFFLL